MPASSCLEEVNPRRAEPQQKQQEAGEEEEDEEESELERPVPVIVEPPELEMTEALSSVRLEDRRRSEEEDKRRSEEEEAARERAAQRQQLAVEELVQSERNYLRLLQLTTVTIRSNLQKLQVMTQRRSQWNSRC